ncbi:TLDc domain-containing protein [Entamoeba marina]
MNTHHQEASSSFNNNYLTIEETTIIDCLKKWSGKNSYSILFDSDIDGNGTDNTLPHKILGKNKLYFIHFDENQNVFGGYINSTIDIIQNWIKDPKAFLFSLIRNGKIKNEQYPIQKNSMDRAFSLYNNWYRLYCFGQGTSDILVEKWVKLVLGFIHIPILIMKI